ncbi:uncharacterized protein LOC123298050 [Chrysoperla carnea]|uniref:uncharacterized protein LOC123298050 n=1 Tax=Chrysoperla carnea TaxID=189513 RepID=UPI001D07FC69|nr:uncharacterized protein LOC123298050 [Chrysoperla carnea]
MKCTKMTTIPVNPRLPFGVRLSEICADGTLHPGLRDLFLKAYLNIADDTISENNEFDNYMQKALSFGVEGHGSLDDRLLLKDYLENGLFIISLKTPPGAPIWVVRHFLGRLPKPLLSEFDPFYLNTTRHSWIDLALECRNGVKMATSQGYCLDKLKMKIATTLIQLEKSNYLVLSALIGLIRNLGAGRDTSNSRLNKRVIFTLVCYFTQALFSRPFRPGWATENDRRFYPLMLFLIYYWPDIRHIINKLNSNCLDEHLSLGKPRKCDSLPIKTEFYKDHYRHHQNDINKKKTYSLDSGGRKNNSSISTTSTSTSKPVNYDEKEHTRKQSKSSNSKPSLTTESHCPILYKCCNCKTINQIDAKIVLNATKSNNLADAATQSEELTTTNHDKSKTTCPCNIENCINLNEIDSFEQNNMALCLCTNDISKENFNTNSIKCQTKNIEFGEDLFNRSQDQQYLDTLSEEDTAISDLSSETSTTLPSDYSSEGSSKNLIKKLNVSSLRSKLKMFTARKQREKTRPSYSDEFMIYSRVKYKKINNLQKNT